MEPYLTIMRKWRPVPEAYSFLVGVAVLIQAEKVHLNYIRAGSPVACLMNKQSEITAAQQQEEQWRQTVNSGG